jgi:radical SAM protein with 4Fe4S-binding SPASM domain
MNNDAIARYDSTRSFSDKMIRSLCYAPFTSLYFDVHGNVRVCCHNAKYPIGNVRQQSIDDIWRGDAAKRLRESLVNYQFGPGCEFCRFQTSDNCVTNVAMRKFDEFPVTADYASWPRQMEFSISNVCNLECIMCRGLWSSAIRAHREKLGPLPRLYSNDFLVSLRKYLPHLKRAKFLGGEPFLVEEYFRLWRIMIEDSLKTPCHVTTNGTQYNSRIEKVLESIPMGFAVSIDAACKSTYETIRVNGNYEKLLQHLRIFRDYTRRKGTSLTFTFCLMRQNWEEFGEFCEFADDWDCPVWVNTVLEPPEFGIYTLPPGELKSLVSSMESQAIRLDSSLRRNRAVWFQEFERLRSKSAVLNV